MPADLTKWLLIGMCIAALLFLINPAPAQSQPAQRFCLPYEKMAERLQQQYGEYPMFAWPTENGKLIEFWVSPTGGTATFIHRKNGEGCIAGTLEDVFPIFRTAIQGEPT